MGRRKRKRGKARWQSKQMLSLCNWLVYRWDFVVPIFMNDCFTRLPRSRTQSRDATSPQYWGAVNQFTFLLTTLFLLSMRIFKHMNIDKESVDVHDANVLLDGWYLMMIAEITCPMICLIAHTTWNCSYPTAAVCTREFAHPFTGICRSECELIMLTK